MLKEMWPQNAEISGSPEYEKYSEIIVRENALKKFKNWPDLSFDTCTSFLP